MRKASSRWQQVVSEQFASQQVVLPQVVSTKIKLVLVIVGMVVGLVSAVVPAGGQAPKAIVILVDRLSFDDFTAFPDETATLRRLANQGRIGMMNVRADGAGGSESGYLSLAMGARTEAGEWAGRALMAAEPVDGSDAAEYYRGITGTSAPGGILHLGIGELERKLAGDRRLGAIGTALAEQGAKAAVFGNADSAGARRRPAALLAMDRSGAVALGDVGAGVTAADPEFPGGLRTAYEAILTAAMQAFDEATLIVVDLTDLARLEAFSPFLTSEREVTLRRESLLRIGALVESLLGPALAAGADVFLLSPSPSTGLGREMIFITPVLHWVRGAEPGLLTSGTTRREGIVANTDFLPTLAQRLALEVAGGSGRAWDRVADFGGTRQTAPSADPVASALSQYAKIKAIHLQRLPIIRTYFFSILGLFATGAALLALLYHRRRNQPARQASDSVTLRGRWLGAWRLLLTAFAAFPVALLFQALLPPTELPLTTALIVGWIVLLTAGALLLERWRDWSSIAVIATLTVVALVGDIVARAPLMQGSLLGYDPVSGSRYYGIGNEYMGVLIGAALIAGGFLADRLRLSPRTTGYVSATILGIVAILFIHPQWGINVGGAIAALVAAGAAFLYGRRASLTWKSGLAWASVIALVIGGAGVIDSLLWSDKASHLGRVVQTVSGAAGGDPLWAIFSRKVAVNVRLIRLTVWSRVVFVAFASLGALLFLPNEIARYIARKRPALLSMSKAAMVAAVAALAANDSGVVAAATLLMWPMLAVLAVAFESETGGKAPIEATMRVHC